MREGLRRLVAGQGVSRRVVFPVALVVGGIGCACAIYLCWRPTGQISTVPWIPTGVAEWADRHGRFRNLPAYFLLACPFLVVCGSRRARMWAVLALGVFGTLLELAERFVPGRMLEWQDVAYTWAGVGTAWLCYEALRWTTGRGITFIACDQHS